MGLIRLSGGAAEVIDTLGAAGHRAYAVGGCVRDSLLGLRPQDWDVCTDAPPQRVMQVFGEARCIPTGIRHGTVTVRAGGELIEVTAFRVEDGYSDGRHPDRVTFVGDVREDLSRRDFTVNAMAYREDEGLVDPFGGRADLEDGLLRAVGDPRKRFDEDALRILRLFRFGAKLGFALEESTRAAALERAVTLSRVSAERIYGELQKLLTRPKPGAYLPKELAAAVLPEALDGGDDAYEKRLAALDAAEPCLPVRLAALLAGADEARAKGALLRLRAPNAVIRDAALLVARAELAAAPQGKPLRVQARRCLGEMTLEDIRRLCALRQAQIAAGIRAQDEALDALLMQAQASAAAGECVSLKGLAVRGDEVAAAAHVRGRALGELLLTLLECVIGEEVPNEREALLCAARARAGEMGTTQTPKA